MHCKIIEEFNADYRRIILLKFGSSWNVKGSDMVVDLIAQYYGISSQKNLWG
jgi:hypothetical protein